MYKLRIAVFALVVFALSTPAWADAVSDTLVVTDASGKVIASIVATEGQETANGSGFVYIISDSTLVDPSQFGNFTQVLDPGGISDVFGLAAGVAGCTGTYCLAFSSDTETTPVPFTGAPNTIPIEGGGGPFDATMYLAPSLQAAGDHATFTSDANSVPEPSSLLLLGTGLLGLMRLQRKWLA